MDTTAIEIVNKFVLLVLLTQLGKTFTTIRKILSELECDEELGRSIHLIFTMNTLLNNKQFAKRLNQIEEANGKGSVVVFTSKYKGTYRHVKKLSELLGICMDSATCPKVVVMCSNEFRFEDGVSFVNILNNNKTNIERVFAYYDELHKYISPKLRSQIEALNDMKIVKGISAMTATPDRIFQNEGFWSKIKMVILDEFNEENYIGYKDMIFNLVDDYFSPPFARPSLFDFQKHDDNTIGFIEHVLNRYPEILEKGSRSFIPAHVRRVGHNRVRTLVFERCKDAVVIVLNGVEKTLVYLENGNQKTIDLGSISDEEVCKTISQKIIFNKLKDRPLVITGFLCVGMGQTLSYEALGPFTSAILSHLDLANDELYQIFGRVTGRMRNWKNFVQTQIYCPTKTEHRIHVMEECARKLASDFSGEEVTKEDYLAPMNTMGEAGESALENLRKEKEVKAKRPKRPEPIENSEVFTRVEDVNKFLTSMFKKPIRIRGFYRPNGDGGYELSTRLNAYYHKKMDELREEDRLTVEFYKRIPMGMNISSKEGTGQQYMVYPVYPSMESSPSEVRYYVRYLKPSGAT